MDERYFVPTDLMMDIFYIRESNAMLTSHVYFLLDLDQEESTFGKCDCHEGS